MNHKFEKRVKRIYAMLSCFVLVAVMTVCPAPSRRTIRWRLLQI